MITIHAMNDYHDSLERCLLSSLKTALSRMPVVVLTGARQTGKTTLVRNWSGERRVYLTLDDLDVLERAEREPDALLDTDCPMTIDEVQRSPSLLHAIKRHVDLRRQPGQFLLTGSANLALMGKVSESLAGRAVYKTLLPMTASEKGGRGTCGLWDELRNDPSSLPRGPFAPFDWPEATLAGGFPPAALDPDDAARAEWFDGYVRTYLERDLQALSTIEHLADFRRLLRLTALRTGKLMNQSDLARDAGLSQPTAHRYLGLLETSHILMRLPAYAVNRTKRLIKAPRLFLCDSGLACFLAGLHTPAMLSASDQAGFMLENLVLGELLAWRETLPIRPEVLYWRTTSGQEVDFVIEGGGVLTPIEIKASSRVRLDDASGLTAFLDEYPEEAPHAILLYCGRTVERLADRIWAVPLSLALGIAVPS